MSTPNPEDTSKGATKDPAPSTDAAPIPSASEGAANGEHGSGDEEVRSQDASAEGAGSRNAGDTIGEGTEDYSDVEKDDAAAGTSMFDMEATLAYWASLSDNERQEFYKIIDLYFHNLLEEFRKSANEAVTSYSRYGSWNNFWRLLLICLTGGLALLNVLATSWPEKSDSTLRPIFSFLAAIYAVVLALLTNIESYFNYFDKRTSTRESRELYLDAYREFEMLRLTHVYPYGYSAQACFNFNELYRRAVVKDLELRRKIMQLSTTRTGKGEL